MVAVLSLCSGIGGLDLAVKLAIPSARTVAYVEIEAFACEVLVARMEDGALDMAPIWSDIESFDGKALRGKVDLVIAGFPCQPFSAAGRRKAEEDKRHIWPAIQRIIADCDPAFVLLENVRIRAFKEPHRDLRRLGFYLPPPFAGTAAELGAPIIRRRVFALAISERIREQPRWGRRQSGSDPEIPVEHWNQEPDVPRGANGSPYRMDRNKAIGNSVCPVAAAHALIALAKRSKHL